MASSTVQAHLPFSSGEAPHDGMAVASRGGGVNALHCHVWQSILTMPRQYVQDLHRPCASLDCSSAGPHLLQQETTGTLQDGGEKVKYGNQTQREAWVGRLSGIGLDLGTNAGHQGIAVGSAVTDQTDGNEEHMGGEPGSDAIAAKSWLTVSAGGAAACPAPPASQKLPWGPQQCPALAQILAPDRDGHTPEHKTLCALICNAKQKAKP